MEVKIRKGTGSPPQVRGKLDMVAAADLLNGITPAGAGKTWAVCRTKIAGGDHPRRCGENETKWKTTHRNKGSPPQVRGKRDELPRDTLPAGITPAGAGKTSLPKHTP